MSTRIEFGCVGHLIVGPWCRFHRHTQIDGEHGSYRVSTVGDYYRPTVGERGIRTTIGSGADDYFETMVFETLPDAAEGSEGCGCREVKSWSELDCERGATAGAAQAIHERMVKKYMALANRETAS